MARTIGSSCSRKISGQVKQGFPDNVVLLHQRGHPGVCQDAINSCLGSCPALERRLLHPCLCSGTHDIHQQALRSAVKTSHGMSP